VGRALRAETLQAADVDVADERPAGHERRQRRSRVGLDDLPDARAAEAEAIAVQHLSGGLTVLAGEKLVAREKLARKLRVVHRQPLAGVVEGIAREHLVRRVEIRVDAALEE